MRQTTDWKSVAEEIKRTPNEWRAIPGSHRPETTRQSLKKHGLECRTKQQGKTGNHTIWARYSA